jgi:hypothetical protein
MIFLTIDGFCEMGYDSAREMAMEERKSVYQLSNVLVPWHEGMLFLPGSKHSIFGRDYVVSSVQAHKVGKASMAMMWLTPAEDK